MASTLRRLRRHRGLAAAVALALIGWSAWAGLRPSGPRSRRVDRVPVPSFFEAFPDMGPDSATEFSPDARVILERSGGPKLRDAATGRVVTIEGGVRLGDAIFLAGSRYLVGRVYATDGPSDILPSLCIWDVATGRLRETFPDLANSLWHSFITSDDGSTLAYVHDPMTGPTIVTVWKPDGSRHDFSGSSPLALSADGRFVALVGPDKENHEVWEMASGRRAATFPVAQRLDPGPIALSPDGRLLVESGESGLGFWDVATSARRADLASDHRGLPWFSPDGTLLYKRWSTQPGPEADIWDLSTRLPRKLFRGRIGAVSADGRRFAQLGPNLERGGEPPAAVRRGGGVIVDLPSLAVGRGFDDIPGASAQLSRDGRWLASREHVYPLGSRSRPSWVPSWLWNVLSLGRGSHQIRVYDAFGGGAVATIRLADDTWLEPDFAFSADGRTLAVRSLTPDSPSTSSTVGLTVELWDVPAKGPSWPIPAGLSLVAIVAGVRFDVRSRRVASAAASP